MRSQDPARRRATLLGSLALLLAGSLALGAVGAITGRSFVTSSGAAVALLALIGLVAVVRPQVRWLAQGLVPVAVSAVAGLAWQSQFWFLHPFHLLAKGASVAAVAALVVLAAGRDPRTVLDRSVHAVGVLLAQVFGTVAFGVLVVPAWAWSRVRRRDVLHTTADPSWTLLPPEPAASASHLGASRSAPPSLSLLGRGLWAVGCAVAILAVNFGVGWTWDKVADDRPAGAAPAAPAAPADVVPYRDPRNDVPSMADYPWRARYFLDLQRTNTSYWPYTEYRPSDFTSPYINQRGWHRRVYEAKGDPASMPVFWMFGGSTTWGEGQRDEYTIASWLVRLSEADGIPIKMFNYGERGWVHFQEMILYEQQLASEPDPDFSIFYDGANEISTQSLLEEAVPSHTLAYTYAKKLYGASVATRATAPTTATKDLLGQVVDAYQAHSALHKLVDLVRGTAAGATPSQSEAPGVDDGAIAPGFTPGQEEERGAIFNYKMTEQDGVDAGKVYERSKQFTMMLSKRHKVRSFLFWQPMGYDGPPQQRAREQLKAPTIDIAHILEGKDVFIDGGHTNEEGARLVAEEIWKHVEPSVRAWYRARR